MNVCHLFSNSTSATASRVRDFSGSAVPLCENLVSRFCSTLISSRPRARVTGDYRKLSHWLQRREVCWLNHNLRCCSTYRGARHRRNVLRCSVDDRLLCIVRIKQAKTSPLNPLGCCRRHATSGSKAPSHRARNSSARRVSRIIHSVDELTLPHNSRRFL